MLSAQSLALLAPEPTDNPSAAAWKRLMFLTFPHLPSGAYREFAEIASSMIDEQTRKDLESYTSFDYMCKLRELHYQQQAACRCFIKDLLEIGMQHDPEFFKTYQENFRRLCEEIYVEPPSKEDVTAQAVQKIEQRLGRPLSTIFSE